MYINEERIIKQNVNNWWLWMRILCTILASFLSVCSMILKLLRFQTRDTLNHHEALKPYQFFIFYDWCICSFLKVNFGGFPGGLVVKNLPCNAKDKGSIPGPGSSHMPRSNLAHVPQVLSQCSRAHEPQPTEPPHCSCWSLHAYSLCSATREVPAMRSQSAASQSSPRLPQLEQAREQQRKPTTAQSADNN